MIEATALAAIADVHRLERELLDAQCLALAYRDVLRSALDVAQSREVRIESLEIQILAVREEIRRYVRAQVCS